MEKGTRELTAKREKAACGELGGKTEKQQGERRSRKKIKLHRKADHEKRKAKSKNPKKGLTNGGLIQGVRGNGKTLSMYTGTEGSIVQNKHIFKEGQLY